MTKAENPSPSPGNKPDAGDNNGNGPTKPGKPGNDPDQTPTREIQDPPVADPNKVQEPPKQPATGS